MASLKNKIEGYVSDGTVDFGIGVAGLVVTSAVGPEYGTAVMVAVKPFTTILYKVAGDISNRVLSPREEQRVSTALTLAAKFAAERIRDGEKPRTDDFWNETPDDRSTADEIIESVLIASQREPSEKKLEYLARLLASIPFEPAVDRAYASFLTRTVENLSYRQLVLLSYFHRLEELGVPKPPPLTKESVKSGYIGLRPDAARELHELTTLGLLNVDRDFALRARFDPYLYQLTMFGSDVCNLARLKAVPREDIVEHTRMHSE